MLKDLAFEIDTSAESKRWIADLAAPPEDDDASLAKSAAAFGDIKKLLEGNLTDVRVVKVGPMARDGSLSVDRGLYSYMLVGKAADGNLAGVMFGAVET